MVFYFYKRLKVMIDCGYVYAHFTFLFLYILFLFLSLFFAFFVLCRAHIRRSPSIFSLFSTTLHQFQSLCFLLQLPSFVYFFADGV